MKKKLLMFLITLILMPTMFIGCAWQSPITGITWTPDKAHRVVMVGTNIGKALYLSPIINSKLSTSTKSSLESAYLRAKTTNEFVTEVNKIVKKEAGVVLVEEDTNIIYISTAPGENK